MLLDPPPEGSALFAALGSLPAGVYVDAAPVGFHASRLAGEFVQAGWHGVRLTIAGGGDIGALLAAAGVAEAHCLAVRGNGAVRALEMWHGGACRPLAVLVETGPLALLSAPAPAWRSALARNGYLFAVSSDGYDHFVRGDQPGLHAQIAEHASLAWRSSLQASRSALLLAQREAEQARSALLVAQAKGTAAIARATMLQQQIDAIHASTSWRSTRLLRWSGRLRREPGPALRQLRMHGRTRLIALLRTLALRVAASPGLRRHLAALALRNPVLAQRLRDLLRPGTPLSNALTLALPPAIDPNNVIGPQFKTLLLGELGRDMSPPSS